MQALKSSHNELDRTIAQGIDLLNALRPETLQVFCPPHLLMEEQLSRIIRFFRPLTSNGHGSNAHSRKLRN